VSELPPAPGVGAILDALDRHQVDYLVVGAVAMQAQGWPQRTRDLDITPRASRENLAKLARAVIDVGGRFRIQGYEESGFAPPGGIDARTFESATFVTFKTDHGDLDVILRPDGFSRGYDELEKRARKLEVPGTERCAWVAHGEDVMRSKEVSNREKDLNALPAMRVAFDSWERGRGIDK
jgi:hypothetical protein